MRLWWGSHPGASFGRPQLRGSWAFKRWVLWFGGRFIGFEWGNRARFEARERPDN